MTYRLRLNSRGSALALGALLAFICACTNSSVAQQAPDRGGSGKEVAGRTAAEGGVGFAKPSARTRDIPGGLYCMNVNSLWVENWADPALLDSVKTLNPDVLRIPGGTASSFWDWRRGGLLANVSSIREAPGLFKQPRISRYTGSRLDDYKTLFETTGADAILVLNMLHDDLDSQLEFIETALDKQLPVKYIELGNEYFLRLPRYKSIFPTPESYADKAEEWARAIKKRFPQLEVAVQGVTDMLIQRRKSRSSFFQDWNRLNGKQGLAVADAMTFHEYHGQEGKVDLSDEGYRRLFRSAITGLRSMLDDDTEALFQGDKQAWVTEYNLFHSKDKNSLSGRWVHGLYASLMTLVLLENSNITMACNQVLVGNSSFGALFADEKAVGVPMFKNPELGRQRGLTRAFDLSATGIGLATYGRAIEGKSRGTVLRFPGARPGLYGWMFDMGEGKGDRDLLILNLSDATAPVSVSELFGSGDIHYEILQADPAELITRSEMVKPRTGLVESKLDLPAYSISRIYSRE